MNNNYTVIVDENCQDHDRRNFAYQYDDENFERIEEVCEDCQDAAPHTASAELEAERRARHLSERPSRPARH